MGTENSMKGHPLLDAIDHTLELVDPFYKCGNTAQRQRKQPKATLKSAPVVEQ